MLHLALTLTLTLLATPSVAQSFAKGTNVEVSLMSDTLDGDWGLPDRTADHATTAINSLGDVLVVFHSDRTGYPGTTYGLKQVEAALFTYDEPADQWTFAQRFLLGAITEDSLPNTSQTIVKCERPDVIAVDNSFFVVWTRRYDRSFSNQEKEPAALECAWLTPSGSGSTYTVHKNGLADGRGVVLDGGYFVRECAGVPDAVLLDPGSTNFPVSIGIAYARQTDFGDDLEGNDATRVCHLRFITCEIDQSNNLSTPAPPIDLVSNIQFNGDTSPSAGDSAGLIVPDCAPGVSNFRFWVAYEEQLSQTNLNPPDGRIRLKLYERLPSGTWDELAGHTFGSSNNLYGRRRPNLSAYPQGTGGQDFVSIAFAKINVPNDADVIYEHWIHDATNGLYRATTLPGIGFPNNPGGVVVHDKRPIPLLGRVTPTVRRCYVDRTETSAAGKIIRYDQDSNLVTDLTGSAVGTERPAVSYWLNTILQRDDVAVTWEQIVGGAPGYKRIFLRLD